MERRKSRMKKYAILAAIGLSLVGGGYAAGRYAAPDKVVVTEKVVTVHDVQIVKVVETDKVLDALKNVSQQKDVHKTKVTTKKPDGTVTTTVTVDDKTKTDTQEKTKEEDKTKTVETKKEIEIQTREVTKIVERSRPNWRLQLISGIDMAAALGYAQPYSLLPSDSNMLKYTVLGVGLEHKLLGPLSTGAWVNSRGQGGLTLSLEF
jgi:hypothetical protein